MNNKGLTLVEIIATLVILSVIAVIVTPNVMSNISNYRIKMYESQISTITEAAKSWAADNIDKIPTDGSGLAITLKELQDGGYVDTDLENPKDRNHFDDMENLFSLVYATEITDETGNLDSNYKFTYGTYVDVLDYQKQMAIKYAKDKSSGSITLTTNQLQTQKYIVSNLKKTNGTSINIPSKTINVLLAQDEDGHSVYEATID